MRARSFLHAQRIGALLEALLAYFADVRISSATHYRDIAVLIPELVHAMEVPKDVPETVHKLAAVTFVQTVDFAALCVLCPLLVRGFAERNVGIKRLCAKITENMTKLVDNPEDIAPFLPKLLPILEQAKVRISFAFSCSTGGVCACFVTA